MSPDSPATDRYAEALVYAARAHAGQLRKGTTLPYITHPVAVSAIVLEHGGDEDQALAGLLHDVVEDCGLEHLSVIRERFGERVAAMVMACTDGTANEAGEKSPWRTRKEAYVAHLAEAPDEVLIVSASDKLHNARAILADLEAGHDVFRRFRAGREGALWYYRELADLLAARMPPGAPLARALSEAVATMEAWPAP